MPNPKGRLQYSRKLLVQTLTRPLGDSQFSSSLLPDGVRDRAVVNFLPGSQGGDFFAPLQP